MDALSTDHLQAHSQHIPRVPGVDDAVVETDGAGAVALAVALDAVAEAADAGGELGLVGGRAGARPLDRLHDAGELVGPHDAAAPAGPGEEEARPVRPPAHGVVARAVRRPQDDRDVRHRRAAHGRDHLGSALDDGCVFRLGPYHETGHVV